MYEGEYFLNGQKGVFENKLYLQLIGIIADTIDYYTLIFSKFYPFFLVPDQKIFLTPFLCCFLEEISTISIMVQKAFMKSSSCSTRKACTTI